MTLHLCPCGGEVVAGGKAPDGGGECLACGLVFADSAAVNAAGGSSVIACVGRWGRQRPMLCSTEGCRHEMVALCDEPTAPRRTCDRPMCTEHRTRVGRDRDRCPAHAPQLPLETRPR